MRRLWLLALLLLSVAAFAGDKDKDKDQYCDIKVRVLKEFNSKPIPNAAVVLHAVDSKGRQESGGLNLKTDLQGEAIYRGLPYGTVRVQVIAPEFQTYGEDFAISQPTKLVVVKLKRPQRQYSIYDQPNSEKDKK